MAEATGANPKASTRATTNTRQPRQTAALRFANDILITFPDNTLAGVVPAYPQQKENEEA